MQSPNPYHLLKLNSENTESIPENNQETDTVQLPGNITHRNRNTLNTQNTRKKRPSVVINKHPERQTDFSQLPVVPGTKFFSQVSLPSKRQRKILIVTDSIRKVIRIRELNSFIANGKTQMVSFSGATSKQFLLYLDVHLTSLSADTVIFHVGVIDLL